MLTIYGGRTRLCDGVTRRGFLTIGALGSLSLADIFRAEAKAGQSTSSHKAVINIFLGGGPPHQDMFDLKPDAPAEIRGEFKPIATNVPGIQIGESLPRLAKMMDKCAIIRSVVGAFGGHDAFQCMTGWNPADMANQGGRPSIGSVMSRVQGAIDPSVPPFVGLAARTQHIPWSDCGKPGFLGPAFKAFQPDGPGMANLVLHGVTTQQFADRRRMRAAFDGLRRELDAAGSVVSMDSATERALGVLTSSRLLEAMDISKESDKLRERYGDGKPYKYQYDGSPTVNDHLLMARRLVEAGARCVSLAYGRWDSHGKNFELVRDHGPKLDQCLSALIEDLETRGMLNDVAVIAWGEFGRTPRINSGAGRDHWPQVSCAFLAGGGLRMGQVIGSTNRLGEYATSRPIHFQEILATLYHAVGLDPSLTTVNDPGGRPQHVVEMPPVRELV
jgi:hypothetical protein